MEDARTIRTPVDTNMQLVKGGDENTYVVQPLCHSAVGSLLYLSIAM